MKSKSAVKALILLLASLFVMPLALAQKVKDTGPKYDPTKEVKIKGVVEDVHEVPGQWEGTHLVVKTASGTMLVHLGPSDFLKEMDTSFKKDDQVEITGSMAPNTTEEEILVREITVGNNTVVLRDGKGIPIWADMKLAKTTGK
jgi:uncharacterized protein YdeI (BOF family)